MRISENDNRSLQSEVDKYRFKALSSFNTIVILRPKVITNLTGIHDSFFIPSRLEPVCRYATTQARFFSFLPDLEIRDADAAIPSG